MVSLSPISSFFLLFKPLSLSFLSHFSFAPFSSHLLLPFSLTQHQNRENERKQSEATMELRFSSQFVFTILAITLLFAFTNAVDHNESR